MVDIDGDHQGLSSSRAGEEDERDYRSTGHTSSYRSSVSRVNLDVLASTNPCVSASPVATVSAQRQSCQYNLELGSCMLGEDMRKYWIHEVCQTQKCSCGEWLLYSPSTGSVFCSGCKSFGDSEFSVPWKNATVFLAAQKSHASLYYMLVWCWWTNLQWVWILDGGLTEGGCGG